MAAASPFPTRIPCRLGELLLHELHSSIGVSRYYEPQPEWVAIEAGNRARLIAWPPDAGISDVDKAGRFIETTFASIVHKRLEIMKAAEPLMTETVRWWWGDEECPTHRVGGMLADARFISIAVNLDGPHELYLAGNDLVSNRDIVIRLSGSLIPIHTQLDG